METSDVARPRTEPRKAIIQHTRVRTRSYVYIHGDYRNRVHCCILTISYMCVHMLARIKYIMLRKIYYAA